jgi:selenocysteine lyase/cysteine desulfurase
MNKREFIKTLGIAGIGLPFVSSAQIHNFLSFNMSDKQKQGNDFWKEMRNAYTLKSEYINLENGYYNILPQATLNAQWQQLQTLNLEGSYYMRTRMAEDKQNTRQVLADFLQCPVEEIIITRNTTESLDTVICGYDWKPGDEAIMAEQEYGSMLDMFKQQAKRYGMLNKYINLPLNPSSDEEIISLYQGAITPKTRIILVSHMVNITGQILPIRKICDMAHQYGVKVIVDGAHAVAHLDFKISDLNCDYYGASLHKWLAVPLGAGLLYVKKENIKDLWPLFGESGYSDADIRKLNHTGTYPIHSELTIPAAIQFHQAIGSKRKEERLRYLQRYWSDQVRGYKNIVLNTPAAMERSCGIANVGVTGYKPAELAKYLLDTWKIWTVAIDNVGVHGCRITPNVYTNTDDLDTLVIALKAAADAKG